MPKMMKNWLKYKVEINIPNHVLSFPFDTKAAAFFKWGNKDTKDLSYLYI